MAVEPTYATISEVDTYANDNGQPLWAGISNEDKTLYVLEATHDMIRVHNQTPSDGTLWLPTDTDLNKACIIQALYLFRNYDYRVISERISNVTTNEYRDSVMEIDIPAVRQIDPHAGFLVGKVLKDALDNGTLISRPVTREFIRA